jgi:3-methyladenine DNA glycosylase/8-oxoguanine DNA glycosylase
MLTVSRTLVVDRPYHLVSTMRPLADGGRDPTWQFSRDRVVRAMWSPAGAATVAVVQDDDTLDAAVTGPGATWVAERLESFLGLEDDEAGFDPGLHPVVRRVHAARPGLLFGRSLSTWDVVVPVVLGQRVTTGEARRSWRQVVYRYGHSAPGSPEVRLPPLPETVAKLGDHHWHELGVERKRADAIRGVLGVLHAVEALVGDGTGAVDPERTTRVRQVLEKVPGVGQWTSTALAIALLGDPDVVLLGDLHVPDIICNALAGEPSGTDDRMLELLEPFRPQRGRVARLVKLSGIKPARRAPKYSPLPIAEM